ncbi:DUF3991 domain-containing protein [Rufibacter sp. XAAS-G3-1]|uniref:DUF3991 domain-containing protein n=1 Tax=Rufibacter sp. XAAS-G3-1 TaxID=2729134 RepID=UPI0015E6FBFE|nr:DUF3991 domain-containing protein [Rufibacter sp. XAAS-G3-1]
MTFQEFREKVPISQVAESLGYEVDLKKGRKTLEYNHKDGDTVLIDPVKQLYYNRDGTTDRGDVIEFVKNRLERFNVSYQHTIQGVNNVLKMFANEPQNISTHSSAPAAAKEFNSGRYQAQEPSIFKLHYLIKGRGLDVETVQDFKPFIKLIKDTEKEKAYDNIGFPLTRPGNDAVVGWDIRNYGFKGVAAGSDRQNGMWIADFAGNPERTSKVFFGENPIDLMSFYQLNKHKIDFENAALVSFGGGIAKSQLQSALKYWEKSEKHTVFDNDYQGKMYDIAVAARLTTKQVDRPEKKSDSLLFTVDDKKFEIPASKLSLSAFEVASGVRSNIKVHKATGEANGIPFKDFNDIIHPKNEVVKSYKVKI